MQSFPFSLIGILLISVCAKRDFTYWPLNWPLLNGTPLSWPEHLCPLKIHFENLPPSAMLLGVGPLGGD